MPRSRAMSPMSGRSAPAIRRPVDLHDELVVPIGRPSRNPGPRQSAADGRAMPGSRSAPHRRHCRHRAPRAGRPWTHAPPPRGNTVSVQGDRDAVARGRLDQLRCSGQPRRADPTAADRGARCSARRRRAAPSRAPPRPTRGRQVVVPHVRVVRRARASPRRTRAPRARRSRRTGPARRRGPVENPRAPSRDGLATRSCMRRSSVVRRRPCSRCPSPAAQRVVADEGRDVRRGPRRGHGVAR